MYLKLPLAMMCIVQNDKKHIYDFLATFKLQPFITLNNYLYTNHPFFFTNVIDFINILPLNSVKEKRMRNYLPVTAHNSSKN